MNAVDLGVPKAEAEAARWYLRAAEQGNEEAQNNLGNAYRFGRGIGKDDAEAARWFRKAAEQGHADAQDVLGSSYALGRGVPKDEAEAVRWFRKAAEQGVVVSQYNLGVMYSSGMGVAKDVSEPCFWLYLGASASDNPRTITERDIVGAKLTTDERLEIQQRCRTWAATHTSTSN